MKFPSLLVFALALFAATGVVRSVEFQKFAGVSVKEIEQRLSDRDIQLVRHPYDPRYVETAQKVVEELLAEKGQRGTHVTVAVTELEGGSVKITFTAIK